VLAFIKVPSVENAQRLILSADSKVEVKFDHNQIEIKAPEPETLLAQIQTYGGLLVQDGLVIEAKYKEESKQKFKLEEGVLHIEAPAIELQVMHTVAGELTGVVTTAANVDCDDNDQNWERGRGRDRDRDSDSDDGDDNNDGDDDSDDNDDDD
jgi:hypothetical protein